MSESRKIPTDLIDVAALPWAVRVDTSLHVKRGEVPFCQAILDQRANASRYRDVADQRARARDAMRKRLEAEMSELQKISSAE